MGFMRMIGFGGGAPKSTPAHAVATTAIESLDRAVGSLTTGLDHEISVWARDREKVHGLVANAPGAIEQAVSAIDLLAPGSPLIAGLRGDAAALRKSTSAGTIGTALEHAKFTRDLLKRAVVSDAPAAALGPAPAHVTDAVPRPTVIVVTQAGPNPETANDIIDVTPAGTLSSGPRQAQLTANAGQ